MLSQNLFPKHSSAIPINPKQLFNSSYPVTSYRFSTELIQTLCVFNPCLSLPFPLHDLNFKQNQTKSNSDEFFNLHKLVSVLKFKRNKFIHHPSLTFSGITSISKRIHLNPIQKDISIHIKS